MASSTRPGRSHHLADLGAMLNPLPAWVSTLLAEARRATGTSLVTKGYHFDQGLRPTHKAEVVALYESGLDEVEIARQTGHVQASVGRSLRDYERVRLLLSHWTPVERIPQTPRRLDKGDRWHYIVFMAAASPPP